MPSFIPPEKDSNPFSRPQTPVEKHKVAFVGIGAMGYFMARNLASSQGIGNHPLLVWNRSPAKAEALLEELGSTKIRVAASLAEVATESDIIITNLANDAVVTSVYEDMISHLVNHASSKSKLFVETSTIYPALAGQLEEMLDPISYATLITAPVFGAPVAADKAQLVIVTSGDHRSKTEIAHLLVPAVGRKIVDLGGNLEKAPTLKLIGNSIILGFNASMAQSLTLAEKASIGAESALDLVKELFPTPIIMNYADKMTHDKFDGSKGFSIDGGIKDAQHIRQLTSAHGSPMPIIDIVHQQMITAKALHNANKQANVPTHDVLDMTAIIAASRIAAGLDAFDSKKHGTSQVVRPSTSFTE